jgi:chemotaxis protein MotB
MKFILFLFPVLFALVACVPAKKYNELVEREKKCSEDLQSYKNRALTFEGKATDLDAKFVILSKDVTALRQDTMNLGNKYRMLQTQYDKMVQRNESMEESFDKLRLSGAKQTAGLQADLDAKSIELQRKQDELNTLEGELQAKQIILSEREQRVNELEEMIRRKDEAVTALKLKVSNALKGFENKGLTVVEKNGKIYVSLEAKLLFASGSTKVEAEGQKALVELAKVLQTERDLEIIVEGHTDTDKLSSASHPKNNWELSVLRSTSVVEIMLANSAMNPTQLMAGGRSEYLPVNPADKAKNRRIEIIISPNLNELFELIAQ